MIFSCTANRKPELCTYTPITYSVLKKQYNIQTRRKLKRCSIQFYAIFKCIFKDLLTNLNVRFGFFSKRDSWKPPTYQTKLFSFEKNCHILRRSLSYRVNKKVWRRTDGRYFYIPPPRYRGGIKIYIIKYGGIRDCMVVGFITTYAISAYHH